MADIKYDYTYFHKLLLKQKSLNFTRYQHITEKDLLLQVLNNEDITDYSEINWRWLCDDLYGREDYIGDETYFNINGELEEFIRHIVPREERVRILTYLRDNCRECLFNLCYNNDCVESFETECARLISYEIEQSKNDRYFGDFATWPKPNLKQIAIEEPRQPEYSLMETAFLRGIPNYSEKNPIVSKDILLQVAYEFINRFRASVKEYDKSGRDDKLKPSMSYKQYADKIYNMIIARANRYLYWNRMPVYQVYFLLGCLMGMPDHRRSWYEEKFAEGIGDYLEMTDHFKGSKEKIKNVIQGILTLSQYQLDFDGASIEASIAEQTELLKYEATKAEQERMLKPKQEEQQKVEPATYNVPSPDDSFFAVTDKITREMCQKELLRCIREAGTKAAACRAILTSSHVYFILSDKTNKEIANVINPWVAKTNKKYVFTADDFRKARIPKKK